eukprot:4893594-Amphidinium_carterae.1
MNMQVDTGHDNFTASLKMAKAFRRLDSERLQESSKEQEEVLESYAKHIGVEKVHKLQEMMPFAQRYAMQAVPDGCLDLYEMVPDKTVARAQVVCSYMFAHKNSQAGAAVDEWWAELHQTVEEESTNRVAEKSLKPSVCQEAGICLCKESHTGKQLMAAKNAFLRALKDVTQTKETKSLLSSGMLLVKFTTGAGNDDATSTSAHSDELMFHIALMYWKPYRPTLHQVCFVACPAEEEARDYTYVQVTGKSQTVIAKSIAVAALDLAKTWSISWYKLHTSTSPLMTALPHTVAIKEWHTSVHFWPKTRSKPVSTREVMTGWGKLMDDMLPVLEDDDDDDNDEAADADESAGLEPEEIGELAEESLEADLLDRAMLEYLEGMHSADMLEEEA